MRKQETLEEVAERILANNIDGLQEFIGDQDLFLFYKDVIKCYGKEMAKWQEQNSEKKYSEEEVIYLLDRFWDRLDVWYNETEDNELNLRKWFEQYKNK